MSSGCPNSDPNFNKVLSTWIDPTPQVRQNLFYMVCIPVRIILYYIVYLYRDHPITPFVVALLSILTMVHLHPDLDTGRQWWSKRWDYYISLLLIVVCIGVAMKKVDSRLMPGLLYLSLVGGILQSLRVTFC